MGNSSYNSNGIMRKVNAFICFLCIIHLYANAQLYVDQNGKTTMGHYYDSSYNGLLNVNSVSNTPSSSIPLAHFYTNSNYCALSITNVTQVNVMPNDNWYLYGINVGCESNPNSENYGVYTWVFREDAINTGRAYGLKSYAGRSTDGWNYGVCTSLLGEKKGAGIYASSGTNPDGYNVNGTWAGFFDGNVKIVGSLTTTTIRTTSDYRLKENIRQIDEGILNQLMRMNVVKYRIKNLEVDLGDTAQTVSYTYPEDSPILKTDHYGLIAQELKEIYPELVSEGEDGYLSVNYMELVPILIKSIQELTSKVNALEKENGADRSMQRDNGNTKTGGLSYQAILYQNAPNPFAEATTIECSIPGNVQSAVLYIYDMNGHQIDSRTIFERGDVSLTIEGSSLDAGMYLYSLITDGVVVDTKRMILTK